MSTIDFEETVRRLQTAFGQDILADPSAVPEAASSSMASQGQALRSNAPSGDSLSDSDGPTSHNVVKSTLGGSGGGKGGRKKVGYRHLIKRGDFNRPPQVNGKAAAEVQSNQPSGPLKLATGEVSPKDWVFTPWEIVVKYPRHFIGNTNRGPASPYFQPPAIFDNQIWDFFYLQPLGLDQKPVLLVPVANVNHLLAYVNAALGIRLAVPVGASADRFNVQFGMGGAPRPRYLGRSTSSIDFGRLQNELASMKHTAEPLKDVTGQALECFRELVEGLGKISINKGGEAKRKNKARLRVAARQKWGRATKRVQRYLGLRKKIAGNTDETLDISGPSLDRLSPKVKFVCVDVETYERSQQLVTEIGFAELDTSSLSGIPPGDQFQNWFSLIQGSHYIVQENAWAKNGIHVENNRENFNFGTSQVVPLQTLREIVMKTLGRRMSTAEYQRSEEGQLTPVVLVGHDIEADIGHLQKIGYNPRKILRIVDVVDTAHMFQHWRRERNPASLGRVLAALEIPNRYLHNGGNDAVYTLQAMLAMARETRQDSFDRSVGKKTARDDRILDESDGGWSTGGEQSDGGDAIAPGNDSD